MKIIMTLFSMMLAAGQLAGQGHAKEIEALIHQYNKGGVSNDVDLLQSALAPSFRVVFNDAKSGEVKVLDRATYLDLIGKKVFGGQEREVIIESIQVDNDLIGTVKVIQKGAENSLRTFLGLTREKDGWKITQDLVIMK